MSESTKNINVTVEVTSGVPGALLYRFATWQGTTPGPKEVITHVPGANGAVARGILAEAPRADVGDGFYNSSIVVPDGSVAEVELGEAVTVVGSPLRVGGNSSEVDGAAYLADAQGDFIVGYALETGGVGAIIKFQFLGFAGLVP
jgi:hypothetical protein